MIGSTQTSEGAEDIIDSHDVGMYGCTAIKQITNEPTFLISFENGKETTTKRYEQFTTQEVNEKEKYNVGPRRGLHFWFVCYLYKVIECKRVKHVLLYNPKTGNSVAVLEDGCSKINAL